MKKCTDCKFCANVEYGYSNYTVEGVMCHCLLDLNPGLPEDRFYNEEGALKYAEKCSKFKKGKAIDIDVDKDLFTNETGLSDYSDDTEVMDLLSKLGREFQ